MRGKLLLFAGGLYPQTRVTQLVELLHRAFGCRVLCLHPAWASIPGKYAEPMDVEVFEKPYCWHYMKLRRMIREEDIRVVWAYNLPPLVHAIAGTLLSGTKLVANFAGEDIQSSRTLGYGYRNGTVRRLVVRAVYAVPNYFICMSPFTRDLAIEAGIPDGKLVTIPNMFDIDRDFPLSTKEEVDALRRELALCDRKIIVCVASHRATKRTDQVLRSLRIARSRDPRYSLVLIGSGELLTRNKELAHRLGVADDTRFITHVERTQLRRYYALADVSCNVSDQDAFCNPVIEALTQGTPVVVGTRVGAARYLDGLPFCRVVNPDDEDWVAASLLLMVEERVKATYAAQAIEKAREFAVNRVFPRWQEFFSGLLQ